MIVAFWYAIPAIGGCITLKSDLRSAKRFLKRSINLLVYFSQKHSNFAPSTSSIYSDRPFSSLSVSLEILFHFEIDLLLIQSGYWMPRNAFNYQVGGKILLIFNYILAKTPLKMDCWNLKSTSFAISIPFWKTNGANGASFDLNSVAFSKIKRCWKWCTFRNIVVE